jgi:hypothetical protein
MNGSKKMVYRVSTCCLLILFYMLPVLADEQVSDEELPSLEFLEFIGEWETDEGDWIDPLEMERDETVTLFELLDNEN